MQMVSGLDGQILAGRVLMQLGSPEKAVTDTVKEVIRILKKTQATAVPQVKLDFPNTDCPTAQLALVLIMAIPCQMSGHNATGVNTVVLWKSEH